MVYLSVKSRQWWLCPTNKSTSQCVRKFNCYVVYSQDNNWIIFGMAAMPILCRDLSFLPKLSYHRNVSLAVYSTILYFSFLSKNKYAFV